jgi:hypothetical protein
MGEAAAVLDLAVRKREASPPPLSRGARPSPTGRRSPETTTWKGSPGPRTQIALAELREEGTPSFMTGRPPLLWRLADRERGEDTVSPRRAWPRGGREPEADPGSDRGPLGRERRGE